MRRKFVDLNLYAPANDLGLFEEIIRKANRLGYKVLGVPLNPEVSRHKIGQLKQIAETQGIYLASRVNLFPSHPSELTGKLRRLRRKFEIIAVNCSLKSVARQAAKDRRVDILYFPNEAKRRFFDEAEAELANQGLTALEIEIMQILGLPRLQRVRLLSKLRSELEIAEKYNIPVVLSSGVSDPILMRRPRDMASLAILFDMSIEKALKAVSETPYMILQRNREKLNPNFVAPGLKVIRRGKDCPNV